MDLQPQSAQDDMQQYTQNSAEGTLNTQEEEVTESSDKRIVNASLELDHEVQAVTDGTDRPFIAVRATDRNYCVGCPYELNPTLPGLAAFGEQVVQSMDDSGRSDFKHKVVTIVKVTRAVPPGSNVVRYELVLEIGQSNCLRSVLLQRSECSLLTNVPIKSCLVTFEERPWQLNSRKMTRNNCTDVPESDNELAGIFETHSSSASLGSSVSRDEQSTPEATSAIESYDQIAQEGKLGLFGSAIDEYFESSEPIKSTGSQNVDTKIPVTEESLTKEVLSTEDDKQTILRRFSDKKKEFDAFLESFDKPMRIYNPEPIDHGTPVNEEIIRPEIVCPNIQRDTTEPSTRCQGTTRPRRSVIDTPKAESGLVIEMAQKALNTLDDFDETKRKRILLGVLSSKKVNEGQSVSYYLMIKVAPSNCNEKDKLIDSCYGDIKEAVKICKVRIRTDIDRPLQSAKVVESKCFSEPKARETRVRREVLVGAPTSTSSDDKEIKDYVEKGMKMFSATSDSTNEPFLVEIIDVKKQVVSGILYKITVRLGESTCAKGTKDNCALKADSNVDQYLITVWSRPWLDKGSPDIKVKSLDATRVKRSDEKMPGGVNQISTDDLDVQTYVQTGLQKYSTGYEGTHEPALVEIVDATVQIVSGKLYKIKVKLGESNCPKGTKEGCELRSDGEVKDCEIRVWTQPWVDHGNPEVTVKCAAATRESRSLRGANYSAKMLKIKQNIDAERAFEAFVEKFDKVYSSDDEKNARLRVFKDNLKIIDSLRKSEQGTAEYGASIFADLTPDEFRSKYMGLKPELRSENEIPMPNAEIPNIELPEEFDWRHQNIVTPVKDQGSCGSCWAFAVTGNIEGLYALKHGKLLSLSEQELVDCDKLDEGCNGGLPDNAYRAIERMGGLELETDYPYDARNEKCQFDKSKARVTIVSGVNITTDETKMAQWLVKNGPIAIGINANAMQFYMGGVSHPFKFLCNGNNLDHGVLIVGYGVHSTYD